MPGSPWPGWPPRRAPHARRTRRCPLRFREGADALHPSMPIRDAAAGSLRPRPAGRPPEPPPLPVRPAQHRTPGLAPARIGRTGLPPGGPATLASDSGVRDGVDFPARLVYPLLRTPTGHLMRGEAAPVPPNRNCAWRPASLAMRQGTVSCKSELRSSGTDNARNGVDDRATSRGGSAKRGVLRRQLDIPRGGWWQRPLKCGLFSGVSLSVSSFAADLCGIGDLWGSVLSVI